MMTLDDNQPGTKPPGAIGPFQTEADVLRTLAVRAVYAAFDADPGAGKMAPHNLAMLRQACDAAGIELGAYDQRIAAWLAGWEPQTVAVIAGWVSRASAAGSRQAGTEAL